MQIRCVADGVRGSAAAAFFAIAIAAACAHGASAAGPGFSRAALMRTPSRFASTPKPKILTDVLYVSDTYQNVVTVYDNNQGKGFPVYGRIALPARPEGITTDAADNLYVTQPTGVLVYPPGTYVDVHNVITITLPTTPTKVLADTNNPTDVALGPDGTVYVADQGGPGSALGGDVSVFAPGTTTAAYTIDFGVDTYVDGVTVDAANNLYIAWRDAVGTAYINASPPQNGSPRTTGSAISLLTGDIFRGVLYDDKDAAVVYADYIKPEIWTTPQVKHDQPFDKLGTPDYIGFDQHKSHLFVPDLTHDLIEVYNYPSGSIHALLAGIPGGAPAGCALLPAPGF